MILFDNDWATEGAFINYDTANISFLRVAMVLRTMGVKNWAFPLAMLQRDLIKYDPHNLTDNSLELRERISLECQSNPWYYFREVARMPATGSGGVSFKANRANIAMIWSFFNNIHYIAIQPRQTGKAQPLYSLIKTPTGWTRMGDIKVGDKITAADGTTTDVVNIYPQGLKPTYRVTFEDGRYTDCCDEHLWKVYNRYWSPEETRWRILSLREIAERMRRCPNSEAGMFIPLAHPAPQEDIPLPLDPYLIGALLGDGGLSSGSAYFTSKDEFIVDEIRRLVPDGVIVTRRNDLTYQLVDKSRERIQDPSPFLNTLRSLDMMGKLSYTKIIPPDYMRGSPAQKMALLQGLLDTDGSVDDSGSVSFCTTSMKMAGQVRRLVHSLGGICKITEKTSHYTYSGEYKEGRLAYIVRIRMNNPKELFRLPRKLNKLPENYKSAGKLKLGIKSIEHIGYEPMQCIEINHPEHLYVTDQHIVTHNTFGACAIICYVMYIGGYNLEISLYTKDSDLVQANVGRIKAMRDGLPNYLVHKQIRDTDNKEGLSYEALKNRYRTAIAQKDKQGADNLGRGLTSPVVHGDEPAFCTNIEITYPVMMLSTVTAVENAKRAGQPHSNIFTTTAAPIDTARGRFAYEMVNKAMQFSELIYDLKNKEEAQALVRANSKNDMINGTFSYLMLGLTHKWYEDACRLSGATKEVNDRELLNEWKSGTDTALLDAETIKLINNNKHEPTFTEIISSYVIRWYLERSIVESSAFAQKRLILGMDSSENIGRDFTTLVLVDIATMAVVATFRCNESNTIKIGMFIAQFLLKYRNVTFIPERNSTGTAIVDTIIMMFQRNHVNPFRRIYNRVVQEYSTPEMQRINIDDASILDSSVRKHFGFRTTGKTRPYLYKNTLIKATTMNATRINDTVLIGELSTLSVINGRIDHTEDNHDDMVIAWLLACWLIYFGENLHYYGIDPRMIPTTITSNGEIVDPVRSQQQLQLRSLLKQYHDLLKNADSEVVRNFYMQKILQVQERLDHDIVVEPIGVTKVEQDELEYGRSLYTPQQLHDQSRTNHTRGQSLNKLMSLV